MNHLILIVLSAAWRLQLAGRPFFGLGHCWTFHTRRGWVIGILSTILALYHSPGGKGKPIYLDFVDWHQFPSKIPWNLELVAVWFSCLEEQLPPVWGCIMFVSHGFKGDFNNVITTESHQVGHAPLKLSCQLAENTCWDPNSLVQACSTQAKAWVFPSLTVKKSPGLEASVGDRKSVRQS